MPSNDEGVFMLVHITDGTPDTNHEDIASVIGPVVKEEKTGTKKEEFIKTDVNPYTSPNPNVKTETGGSSNGEVKKEGKVKEFKLISSWKDVTIG